MSCRIDQCGRNKIHFVRESSSQARSPSVHILRLCPVPFFSLTDHETGSVTDDSREPVRLVGDSV